MTARAASRGRDSPPDRASSRTTLQLAAAQKTGFPLGHNAMLVNEGLPNFIVDLLRRNHGIELARAKVGILAMAFKADIDDIRDSLSYKLGKILRFYAAEVSYSDEFAVDPTFISKEALVQRCPVVIVGVPHSAYRGLAVPAGATVVDLWNVIPQ